jgi:DNA mismatch endonuclease (patch repair protein)
MPAKRSLLPSTQRPKRDGASLKVQVERNTGQRIRTQISFNMSRVRSAGSEIERALESAMRRAMLKPKKQAEIFGRPDFAFPHAKVAVFCGSHFWHGYKWTLKRKEIRRNRDFWLPKITANMRRDRSVNRRLRAEGWTVLRFWEHRILKSPDRCVTKIRAAIAGRTSIS